MDQQPARRDSFATEVARVRASGTLGDSGRLIELFDFLAARGAQAPSASQAEIAETVFGQSAAAVDDATVRVYVHRLRKRLNEFYATAGYGPGGARVTLPMGTYALRPAREGGEAAPEPGSAPPRRWSAFAVATLVALAALLGAFLLGRALPGDGGAPRANALWQPFLESDRPIIVAVGDYYMFGEIDPVRPEQSRLIRDFRVNSPTDLLSLQEVEAGRYGNAEDVGLSYLPLSTAYGLRHILPVLAREGRRVSVIPASDLPANAMREANIVYIGLIGAMGVLEEPTFAGSGFAVGETYDELLDRASGTTYTSEEARRLASPVFYRDFGYVARFRAPGGALVAVVAGARETALRGLAPILAGPDMPPELRDLAAADDGLEALFQVTGQQGADLSDRLIAARARPGAEQAAR